MEAMASICERETVRRCFCDNSRAEEVKCTDAHRFAISLTKGGLLLTTNESARPRLRLTERGKEELWASCGCLYFYIISAYG